MRYNFFTCLATRNIAFLLPAGLISDSEDQRGRISLRIPCFKMAAFFQKKTQQCCSHCCIQKCIFMESKVLFRLRIHRYKWAIDDSFAVVNVKCSDWTGTKLLSETTATQFIDFCMHDQIWTSVYVFPIQKSQSTAWDIQNSKFWWKWIAGQVYGLGCSYATPCFSVMTAISLQNTQNRHQTNESAIWYAYLELVSEPCATCGVLCGVFLTWTVLYWDLGLLLLTWFNFNPGMDK